MIDTFEKIKNESLGIEKKLIEFGYSFEKKENDGCIILKARKKEAKGHLVFQSALHGIEGYVGFNLIYYFVNNLFQKFIDKLNCDFTFIINANPFGVKYKRRVNENNVDLNRNFLLDRMDFEKIKDEYHLIDKIINPQKKVKYFYLSYIKTIFGILSLVVKIGAGRFKEIFLCGQKSNPKGSYYMGKDYQTQTLFLMDIYEKLFNEKGPENTIFIDLHTGYGPRYQMSVVNSSYMRKGIDKAGSINEKNEINEKLKKEYPLVVESNTNSFYLIQGDLIDFIYQKYPTIKYATTFEFGTFGDSLIAGIKSAIAVILENQVFFNNLSGSIENLEYVRKLIDKEKRNRVNDKKIELNINKRDSEIEVKKIKNISVIKRVLSFYEDAYFPKEKKWWEKAKKDFEMALISII